MVTFTLLKLHPPVKALLVPFNKKLDGSQSRLECFEEEKNLSHMQALKHNSLVLQSVVRYEHQLAMQVPWEEWKVTKKVSSY